MKYTQNKDLEKLKVKQWKKIYQANHEQKEAGATIDIKQINFRTKSLIGRLTIHPVCLRQFWLTPAIPALLLLACPLPSKRIPIK